MSRSVMFSDALGLSQKLNSTSLCIQLIYPNRIGPTVELVVQNPDTNINKECFTHRWGTNASPS